MKSIILLIFISIMATDINAQEMNNKAFTKEIILIKNEPVNLEDGLSILLTDFSHKRPVKNGPTKATAYLTLKKCDKSQEVTLSVHGNSAEPAKNPEFEQIVWEGYTVRLRELRYDESITVVVTE